MASQQLSLQEAKAGLLSGPRSTVSRVPTRVSAHPSVVVQTGLHLLLLLLATTLFAVTAWFAQATFSEQSINHEENSVKRALKVDVGSTLTILSVLSGLLSAVSAIAISKSLDTVLWTSVSTKPGISCLRLLGISPSTGITGVLGIVFTGRASVGDRAWAFLRQEYLVANRMAVLGCSSLVHGNTTVHVGVESTPVYTYNVTAGLGPFNGSYVRSYISQLQNLVPEYKFSVVPYTVFAIVYNLVVNPMHSLVSTPIRCQGIGCDSYLMTGGLLMTTPWPPTNYMDLATVEIYDVPGIQIEFERGLPSGDSFVDTNDCSVFGEAGFLIGMELCVTESKVNPGSLIAGLYVCPDGVQDGQCLPSTGSKPNLTTTFSVYQRSASMITSRTNFSILSLTKLGTPTLIQEIEMPAYKAALDWILDFNASGIPATTSIAEHFWTAQDQLSNPYWSGVPYQTLQSILALPFWQFNANNYGNIQLVDRQIISSLPSNLYTTASIVEPHTRIVINRVTFALFVAFQSVILIFAWVVLFNFWLCRPKIPEITSYPLIDFAFKAADKASDSALGLNRSPDIVLAHRDSDIREALGQMRIVKRNVIHGILRENGSTMVTEGVAQQHLE